MIRSNSIFKNNKNSMKRIVNKKNENICSRTFKKNFSGLVSPSKERERKGTLNINFSDFFKGGLLRPNCGEIYHGVEK